MLVMSSFLENECRENVLNLFRGLVFFWRVDTLKIPILLVLARNSFSNILILKLNSEKDEKIKAKNDKRTPNTPPMSPIRLKKV